MMLLDGSANASVDVHVVTDTSVNIAFDAGDSDVASISGDSAK